MSKVLSLLDATPMKRRQNASFAIASTSLNWSSLLLANLYKPYHERVLASPPPLPAVSCLVHLIPELVTRINWQSKIKAFAMHIQTFSHTQYGGK
jgi:hypothetical protein